MLNRGTTRYVRPAYRGPACDHTGSVGIRMRRETAGGAPECRLVGPVLLGDVSALRAFAGGVSGINQDQRYSRQLRFVFQKETKLRKRPTVENYSLLAPNLDPVAALRTD